MPAGWLRAMFGAAALIALAMLATPSAAAPARPIETAIQMSAAAGSEGAVARRIRAAGTTRVRIVAPWSAIAPRNRPVAFDPADPADPAYDWEALDRLVRAAHAQKLVPFLTVTDAPEWAQEGKTNVGLGD